MRVFADARGGLFVIVWQLGASSYFSGGFMRVFTDAREGGQGCNGP